MKAASAGALMGIAGAAWWAGNSETRAARWLRRIVADSRREVVPAPVRPDPAAWRENSVSVCWLGHATVLINFYGLTILTDPALLDRVGVSVGVGTLGPKRYVGPALRTEDLPPVDLLLISHAHMDHLDLPTLRRLPRRTPVVSARLTSDLLAAANLSSVREMRWNDRLRVGTPKGDLEIRAFEVKHWGQRWPGEVERGYNGYVLRREGKALIFGGDTALTEQFRNLRAEGPFEAAIMPIGAYRPWIRNHCTPEEAWSMANDAGARYVIPVHHLTFKLSEEPMEEPMQRLSVVAEGEPERLALRRVGETFILPG